jgi:hypothetical protein
MSQADKEALICMANAFGKDESWLTEGKGYNSHVSKWYGIDVTDGRVTGIDWNNEGLRGSIPKEIENLTNLKELFLFENSLSGDIPIELCKLTNLHSLYLWSNNLSCEMPFIYKDRNEVIQFFERLRKRVSQIL